VIWRFGNRPWRIRLGQLLSVLILLLATELGIWAFVSPFFGAGLLRSAETVARSQAHAADAPFIFILLLGLCLVVIVANLETGQMDARLVAVLGMLVGINATLRLIPGPAGFSAVFFLPILAGYAFGATFGFLLGAFSLLVSAIITAGVGPWLPFQMFATGWVGLISGWLPHVGRHHRLELLILAAWGGLAGFGYGLVINLWFWPYLAAPAANELATVWEPGLDFLATLWRYGVFYLTTSIWWDAGRALGNVFLILFAGAPVIRLLRRFQRRFRFTAL
jgi:energy-coupling factor transport system substrate-specific component